MRIQCEQRQCFYEHSEKPCHCVNYCPLTQSLPRVSFCRKFLNGSPRGLERRLPEILFVLTSAGKREGKTEFKEDILLFKVPPFLLPPPSISDFLLFSPTLSALHCWIADVQPEQRLSEGRPWSQSKETRTVSSSSLIHTSFIHTEDWSSERRWETGTTCSKSRPLVNKWCVPRGQWLRGV